MWNIELEKEILNEMLSLWEPFLFSKEIYWPVHPNKKKVPQSSRTLRVSAGRLLITIKILSNWIENDQQQFSAEEENINFFHGLIDRWQANWTKKVSQELPVRIREWKRLITDLRVDNEYSHIQLVNQLQIRLMIDLLLNQLKNQEITIFLQQMDGLDLKFRYQTVESDFVWDEKEIIIFPKSDYWYLYRKFSQPGG